ncbi:MAG: YceD family protein [Bacilli bacterium]
MFINLEELNSNVKDEILISSEVNFDKDLLSNSSIKDLKDVFVNGKIYKDASDEFVIEATVEGKMIIEDSISLEDVTYPFLINIDENIEEILQKDKNTIDIIPILWQNIVLEVPLRYTEVKDLSSYSGDGWKLISEEEVNSNNPFLELKEKYKEE